MEPVTLEQLRVIARDVGERSGWDLSPVREERDRVPWAYPDVVRYLRPGCSVLDIGTGGGEQFLQLVPLIGARTGIDADPGMVATARARTPPGLPGKGVVRGHGRRSAWFFRRML